MEYKVAMKWVKALRSNKYEQNQGSLRKREGEDLCNSFCCLGVLCDVFAEEHPGARWVADTKTIRKGHVNSEELEAAMFIPGNESIGFTSVSDTYEATSVLPNAVKEWAAMQDRSGVFPIEKVVFDDPAMKTKLKKKLGDHSCALSALNDLEQWSFDEIANFIERNYRVL